MVTEIAGSATQAKAILGAWQEGDTQRLCETLAKVEYSPSACYDAAEEERLELLFAIASEWRTEGGPLAESASDVYRKLLRHLAFPDRAFPDRQHRLPSYPLRVGRGPAARAAGLQ